MLMDSTQPQVETYQLMAKRASLAGVFERTGALGRQELPGFRHDDRPLQEVCLEKGFDLPKVVRALHEVDEANTLAEPQHLCAGESPVSFTDMVEHVLYWHHGYLHHELPRLTRLLSQVSKEWGDLHPELLQVEAEFAEMRDGVEIHMLKEEMVLFPVCRGLDETGAAPPVFGSAIGDAIGVMELEHGDVELSLALIRELTGGYTVPAGVDPCYALLYESLAELEADMQQHIHEERHLFAKALDVKRRFCATA